MKIYLRPISTASVKSESEEGKIFMKFLIASDIHGSKYYTEKVAERFKAEQADQLILLGDIYNHGPRNPLPEGYDPMGVASVLNGLAKKLTVVKGNCDSDVDTMISDFEFVSEAVIFDCGKKIFLQHGDRFCIDNLPKNCGDAFLYGHYHTGFIRRVGGLVVADVGHFESEYCAIDLLFDILSKNLITFAVRKSVNSRNPIHYMV